MARKKSLSVDAALASIGEAQQAATEGLATVTQLERRIGVPTLDLPLSELLDNPDNPRTDYDDIEELAGSIAEVGVLQPILVRPLTAAERAAHPGRTRMIIAGHRRRRASEVAGLATIPAVERTAQTGQAAGGDLGDLILMLTENIQRSDITPMDEARSFKVLADAGMTQLEIARKLAVSQPKVSKRLALLELHPAVQTSIAQGSIGAEAAQGFKGVEAIIQERVAKELAQQTDGDGGSKMASPAVVQESVRRASSAVKVEQREAAVQEIAKAAGAKLIKPNDRWAGSWERRLHDPSDSDLQRLAAAGHLGALIEGWSDKPTYYNLDPTLDDQRRAADEERMARDELRRAKQAEKAERLHRAIAEWGRQVKPTAGEAAATLADEVIYHLGDRYLAQAYEWVGRDQGGLDDVDLDDWLEQLSSTARVRIAVLVIAARDAALAGAGQEDAAAATSERIRALDPELADALTKDKESVS